MAHSSRKSRRRKPNKPNPDFPLNTQAAGRWAKKVLGRTCYFTKWSDDLKGKATLEQIDREPTVSGGALLKDPSDLLTGGLTYPLLN